MTTEYITVPLEVKRLAAREISGHGAVFGNVDLGGDVIIPGAFKRTLAEHKENGTQPIMFWQHQYDAIPGAWSDMSEDAKGLAVLGTLAKTPLGDEVRTLLGMKAVRGLSIGYQVNDAEYTDEGVRLLKEIGLVEVSIVSLAMNPLAEVESAKARLSSRGEYVPTVRQFEHMLRDVGCSQSVAKSVVKSAFSDNHRDGGAPRDADIEGINEVLQALDIEATQKRLASVRF